MHATREMPKYQCHKQVWALKIAAIEFDKDGSAKFAPIDDRYDTICTKANFHDRWRGSEGDLGYYVVYEDGYESWSPTSAFDAGYSLIKKEV